jgi:hypothetical protein
VSKVHHGNTLEAIKRRTKNEGGFIGAREAAGVMKACRQMARLLTCPKGFLTHVHS